MGRKTQQREKSVLNPITFNGKIYTLKSIRESADAYSHLALFEIKTRKPYIHVKIKNIGDVPDALLKDEFCNYVLSRLKTSNG